MGACCTPSSGGPARKAEPISRGSKVHELVRIEAGDFLMGNDGPDAVPGDGEGPVRRVHVDAFCIAPTTITNREFGDFVRETHYVTDAERSGASFVFYLQLNEEQRRDARRVVSGTPWWIEVTDACWQRPEGPGSNVRARPAARMSFHSGLRRMRGK